MKKVIPSIIALVLVLFLGVLAFMMVINRTRGEILPIITEIQTGQEVVEVLSIQTIGLHGGVGRWYYTVKLEDGSKDTFEGYNNQGIMTGDIIVIERKDDLFKSIKIVGEVVA